MEFVNSFLTLDQIIQSQFLITMKLWDVILKFFMGVYKIIIGRKVMDTYCGVSV